MASETVLYTFPLSHYCVSAEKMLAFKGLRYRPIRVGYHDHQEVIHATQQDYIPTLTVDGTTVLWADIPDYLERARPTPSLYPGGARGLHRVLENWGHEVLEERVWRAVVTRVPAYLESDAERWVFEELQTKARGPWHVLEARRAEFESDALGYLRLVDGMLAGRSWILGEPGLADFGVYGSLSPWLRVGNPLPRGLPNLAAWIHRIEAIPPTEERATGSPPARDP